MDIVKRVAELAMNGTVEEAKILAQEAMKGGYKQISIDLYRCIIGNDRSGSKRLDRDMVLRLAARLEGVQEAMAYYGNLLVTEAGDKSPSPAFSARR